MRPRIALGVKFPRGLRVLLSGIVLVACASPAPTLASSEGGGASLATAAAVQPRPADKVVDQASSVAMARLPRGLLLALHSPGSTTLASLGVARRRLSTVVSRETGELSVSLAPGKLAYLVRQGVDPARNHVEILDSRRGRAHRLEAAPHFAILGFVLSPSGDDVVYAGMNLGQSRSGHVSWRISMANLNSGEVRTLLLPRPGLFPKQAVPVPFGWSTRTGEVLLQGVLPFRGMPTSGIWGMRPEAPGLRLMLPESSYTGVPRISPDGVHLAYLATSSEALPRAEIPSPGVPPGNVLMVMDLLNGESATWARERGAALSILRWSATGRDVLVSRQEWIERRFRDVALLRVGPRAAVRLWHTSPLARVVDGLDCRDGSFFWLEEDGRGIALRGAGGDRVSTTFLNHSHGRVHLLRCA